MKNTKEIISNNIQGKKVLVLFILTNLVYAVMLLITIPMTMNFSNGMRLLDMMPSGYSSDYVYELLNTLGVKGREVYLYNQIPIDMVYPLLFGISYCLLLAYFLKRLNKLNSILFYLCWLPLIAGAADYFENFGIISLLNSFPDSSQGLIKATSVFSVIKSISTTIYFVALITILIVLGFTVLNKRRGSC